MKIAIFVEKLYFISLHVLLLIGGTIRGDIIGHVFLKDFIFESHLKNLKGVDSLEISLLLWFIGTVFF